MTELLNTIKAGDKVTIKVHDGIGRHGIEYRNKTGIAVMRGPYGWVLNMGGRYGTPAVATEDNLVSVRSIGHQHTCGTPDRIEEICPTELRYCPGCNALR